MSGANVISSTPRTPFVCSHTIVAGASMTIPGTISVSPIQAKIRRTSPSSHIATASWCQPWSNTSRPIPSFWACSKIQRKLDIGTSQPPRPVATIFMCSPAGSPMSPDSSTSFSVAIGGKKR